MSPHTAMANEHTPLIPESVLRASEDSYRRGYWHGYGQALDDIAASTKRGTAWGRLATFYDTVLMRWRYAPHAGQGVRPPRYPDKS